MRRAVESRVVVLPDGTQISGAELETRLEKLIAFRSTCRSSSAAGRRATSCSRCSTRRARRQSVLHRSRQGARRSPTRCTRRRARRACSPTRSTRRTAWSSRIAPAAIRGITASTWTSSTTSEFRTLATSYQDVKGIKRSDDRQDGGSSQPTSPTRTPAQARANDTAIGGAPLDEATKLAAEPKALDASSMPKRPPKRPRTPTCASSRSTSWSSSSSPPARRASRSTATRASAR